MSFYILAMKKTNKEQLLKHPPAFFEEKVTSEVETEKTNEEMSLLLS